MGSLDQGVALVDDQRARVIVNQTAARLLGIACGEVPATVFDAAVSDLERRAANRSEVTSPSSRLAVDASADFDFTWRFPKEPNCVRVSSHSIREESFNGRVWVFCDISAPCEAVPERFDTEECTAASARSYRLLTENIGDVVCHVREDRFALISGPVEGVLGAPAEHWIGRDPLEIIPPEDRAPYEARVQTLIGGGTVKERVRVTGADGVTRWVHMHAKPYHDLDGRRDGVAATFRVVDPLEEAALRDAEEARRQQAKADELYRRSMDNAAVGMCLLDPDGGFREVNGALCEFFGYDAEALKRKTWQALTAPEFLEIDQKNVNELLEGRRDTYRIVKQYVSADGKRIWGDLAVSCIRDQEGRVENFISQITDITATVEADERNRILAQRLQQQSDRLAAELASAASYMSSVMPRGLTGKVEVSSRYLPSRELGGDCFDYVWVDDDHLLVYLIDVSGHGIEPALLSVSVHNMLRTRSFDTATLLAPDAVLAELNQLFQMDQQGDHYFTMWFGVYEASTRTLRYASAGAPPALAFTSVAGNGLAAEELRTKAAPIGMFGDTAFTSNTYHVPSGCRILVYSDGASEIVVPGRRYLTMTEFKDVSARLMGSADWSLDQLVDGLRSLNPQGHFEDDCSLILLSFD